MTDVANVHMLAGVFETYTFGCSNSPAALPKIATVWRPRNTACMQHGACRIQNAFAWPACDTMTLFRPEIGQGLEAKR